MENKKLICNTCLGPLNTINSHVCYYCEEFYKLGYHNPDINGVCVYCKTDYISWDNIMCEKITPAAKPNKFSFSDYLI